MPLTVPTDVHTVNILKDIGTTCGVDVVSALKGELISTINPEKLPDVDFCEVGPSGFTVKSKFSGPTKVLILELKEKMKNAEQDFAKNIYSKRIKSLTTSKTQIQLEKLYDPNSGIIIDCIDSYIKLFREISKFGVIDLESIDLTNTDDTLHNIINCMSVYGKRMPTNSIVQGVKLGVKLAMEEVSVGAALICV